MVCHISEQAIVSVKALCKPLIAMSTPITTVYASGEFSQNMPLNLFMNFPSVTADNSITKHTTTLLVVQHLCILSLTCPGGLSIAVDAQLGWARQGRLW